MKDITVLEMQKQELEEVKYRLKKEQRDLTIRKFLKNIFSDNAKNEKRFGIFHANRWQI